MVMEYLLTFLEGLASFISPCVLPMIPLYLTYFASGENEEQENKVIIEDEAPNQIDSEREELTETDEKKKEKKKKIRVLVRSILFVLGFTLMYVIFGGLIGLLSGYISKYKYVMNIVAGIIVIIFGLSYMGLFKLPFFKGLKKTYKISSVWSAFLFGVVFAVGVGPCTGVFLGSALALASTSGTAFKGIMLLLFYSLGMGIPFIITAVLIDKMKNVFGFIKRHFNVIRIVVGIFLIVMGILMAVGVMDKIGTLIK